jgi:hypothetical protein
MNKLNTLALTLALTASAAFANDHLTQVAAHARGLAEDYRKMTITLKDKTFAPAELQKELQAADSDLGKIKTLLAEYAATGPKWNAAQAKDWQLTQDLVVLLDIFHTRKSDLLTGDNPSKKRKEIRTEAQGLMTRATLLEQAAKRLASSGS